MSDFIAAESYDAPLVLKGSPETVADGRRGRIVSDGSTGALSVKSTVEGVKTGWRRVSASPASSTPTYPIEPGSRFMEPIQIINGSPEGVEDGRIGRLVVDRIGSGAIGGDLYIKKSLKGVKTNWHIVTLVSYGANTNTSTEPLEPGVLADVSYFGGSPEGKVYGRVGSVIVDGMFGNLYLKATTADRSDGWLVASTAAAGTCVAPIINSAGTSGGIQNTPYSYSTTLSQGTSPVSFSIVAGTLPAGLVLSSTSGVVSGTPTGTGPSTVTIRATNGCGSDDQAVVITIDAACVAPTITSGAPGAASQGVPYSFSPTASGSGPITWSISTGTLPTGLTLNTGTGAITGTPTVLGTSNFSLRATNACGQDTDALSIVVGATTFTVYYGSIPAGIPGSFVAGDITGLSNTAAKTSRNGTYEFPFLDPSKRRVLSWPTSFSGGQSITSAGFPVVLNPAPNTAYQTGLVIGGIQYDVFVTANPLASMETAGGNPVVVT